VNVEWNCDNIFIVKRETQFVDKIKRSEIWLRFRFKRMLGNPVVAGLFQIIWAESCLENQRLLDTVGCEERHQELGLRKQERLVIFWR